MKEEEMIPEKFSLCLGNPIATCSCCNGQIYEHDLIVSVGDGTVAHGLCWDMKDLNDINDKGGKGGELI